ncbi:MAG: HlyD family efflux transporter periplasmic adaptor subunit [Agriterribacter sp.]
METDETIVMPSANGTHQDIAFRNVIAMPEDEIDDIISYKPPHIVRWGTVYFFILLLMLCVISWYIKYPDKVIAIAKLNSVNPPQQIVAKTDGKLTAITIKENETITKGEILGYMESIANPVVIKIIGKQADSISRLINENRSDEIVQFFPVYESGKSIEDLGELQPAYQVFIQSFVNYRDYLQNGFYLKQKKMLQTDIKKIEEMHNTLIEQKKITEEDVELSKKTFDVNKSLSEQKVISPLDYRNEKSKLLIKQLSLPQINASIIANEREKNEKLKEITGLENQIIIQKNTFFQAVQTIRSQVQAWQYKYELKASASGSVSFTGFLQENQEIKAGQSLFYIQPDNTTYFVEIIIPQYNFGKVKKGQNVLLKFRAYPFEQYGSVSGKIDFIKPTPTDSGYLASVELPNALLTNYGKQLQYRNGLIAEADIITEDIRLLQRFYYGIINALNKN